MRTKRNKNGWPVWVLLAGLLVAVSGCGGPGAQDQREERDPLLKKAQARKNMNDFDGALELCQRAIDRKPAMARPHLDMALIYDQSKGDYLRAIYHYERYLEMRPQAEKRDLIQELIRHAKLNYAASLPEQPSGAIQEIAMLKKEIESLRIQMARQKPSASVTTAQPAPAAPTAVVPTSAQPQPAQSAMQTYVVQAGDTLSKIAGKVYRDTTQWEVLYEANKSALPGGPQSVRVGQTLMIPRRP